jgi:hypothetical protein
MIPLNIHHQIDNTTIAINPSETMANNLNLRDKIALPTIWAMVEKLSKVKK